MEEYVLRSQNIIDQYIVKRPIMDLCEETLRMLGAQVKKCCCKQEVIDMAGAREAAVTEEDNIGGGDLGKEEAE